MTTIYLYSMSTPKKTWQEKATYNAITTKLTRRKNPVRNFVALAEEFEAPVYYPYWGHSPATSPRFRAHVRKTLGRETVFA